MSHTVIEQQDLVDEGVVVEELFIEEYDIPLSLADEGDRPTLDMRTNREKPLMEREYVKLSLLGGVGLALAGGLIAAGFFYLQKPSYWKQARKLFAAKLGI